MLDVAKTGAHVSTRQHFVGTLSALARDLGLVRSLWQGARVRTKTVRASVKPAV